MQNSNTGRLARSLTAAFALVALGGLLVAVGGCPKPADKETLEGPADDLRLTAEQQGPDAAIAQAAAEVESEQTADAYERLAQAYAMAGKGPEADEALKKALEIQPDHPKSVLAMSIILLEQADSLAAREKTAEAEAKLKEAQEMAERLLDDGLKGPEQVQVARARAVRARGQNEEALKGIEIGLQQYPNSAPLHCAKADTLLQMDKIKEAEPSYREAMRLAPKDPHYVRGTILLLLLDERPEEAAALANEAREQFPGDPKIQLAAGDALVAAAYRSADATQIEAGIDSALAAYEEALILVPDLPPAANNVALLLADRAQQLERAERLATNAVARDKKNNLYADTLGWVWVQQGEYQKGVKILREVIKRAPKNSAVKYHLGTALAKSGSSVAEGKKLLSEAAADSKRPEVSSAAKAVLAEL